MKIPEELPVERISMATIYRSILSSLNLEKGFFFTIREMLLRPDETIHKVLFSLERSRFVKPLPFLLLCVGVSVLVSVKTLAWSGGIEAAMTAHRSGLAPEAQQSAFLELTSIVLQYQNLTELLKVPFLALLTWGLFRRSRLNFAEHLVINAYTLGVQSLFSVILIPGGLFITPAIFSMSLFITFGYYIYVYQQIFKQKPVWVGVVKSVLAAIIAYALASLLLLALLFFYFTYVAPNPDVLVLLRPQ